MPLVIIIKINFQKISKWIKMAERLVMRNFKCREKTGSEGAAKSAKDWRENLPNIKYGGVGRRTGRGRIRSFSLSAGLDFPDLIVLGVSRLIQIHIFIFQRLKAALHYTVGRICEKAGKLCIQLFGRRRLRIFAFVALVISSHPDSARFCHWTPNQLSDIITLSGS